jgi:hypothetical protein
LNQSLIEAYFVSIHYEIFHHLVLMRFKAALSCIMNLTVRGE